MKKIAILASGGNSPAMNNAVITLVRKARYYNLEVELIQDGFLGLFNNQFKKPDLNTLSYFYANGNVQIGSSRFPQLQEKPNADKCYENLKARGIDCLFVIGGDGSYNGANRMFIRGMQVMCLPGTIDNDVQNTDLTIGFSSALNSIVSSIDAIRNCFDSHNSVCIVEVMGRRYPALAIQAGIATQAEAILTVDNTLTTSQIIDVVKESRKNGHRSCIIVATERLYGRDGLPSLKEIADEIKKTTGIMARYNVIGYVQRGWNPTAEDRVLASRMASYALDLAIKDKGSYSIAIRNNKLVHNTITDTINYPLKATNKEVVIDFEKYNKL
ncbi:6-phosphofructokinase [Candidatus Malacoplasma girerdii]|uniref:6-phosphofructokinase n=1 Tax=Candidatus Malacoplasma girerdii TaxID=1318617 RepID=A0A097SSD0_9BACT|nr:6-phosphofructokinase [Candidatus Malacoplasma girerdii]ASJ89145.1 MAG: ATP-dependent 6-phosphofructokinase [Candidatus Malacoplasma girerdii]